jgi:hypothetical protein
MEMQKTIIAITLISLSALLYGQTAEDYIVEGGILTKYRGTLKKVVIPADLGITEIGEEAFRRSDITSVIINAGVTGIGDYAFANCVNLTDITLPTGLTSIGNHAFENCDSLAGIIIPTGVTCTGDYTFFSCDSLVSVTLPDGLAYIGLGAFGACRKLAGINIPISVEGANYGAFYACNSLSPAIKADIEKRFGEEVFYTEM